MKSASILLLVRRLLSNRFIIFRVIVRFSLIVSGNKVNVSVYRIRSVMSGAFGIHYYCWDLAMGVGLINFLCRKSYLNTL